MAYLGRIILCCHQLNITSKVKADIQNVGGEMIVSGVSYYGEVPISCIIVIGSYDSSTCTRPEAC